VYPQALHNLGLTWAKQGDQGGKHGRWCGHLLTDSSMTTIVDPRICTVSTPEFGRIAT
jgi:hypothetical protein